MGRLPSDFVADAAGTAQDHKRVLCRILLLQAKIKHPSMISSECISLSRHHEVKQLLSCTIVNWGPSVQCAEVSQLLSNSLHNSRAGA